MADTSEKLLELVQSDDCPLILCYGGMERLVNYLIANGVTIPVRCKNCKHWFAEDLERCKSLKASPYGWCCRNKTIYDTDHTDITMHYDFCSCGERRTENA